MGNRILELFQKLNQEFPPQPGDQHNLTLAGSRMRLALSFPNGWHWFILEPEDLDDPDQTIAAIRKMADPSWKRAQAESIAERLMKMLFL